MPEYRTGSHWGRTIIRVGVQPADATGKRPDDQLVGTMDDPGLAERICSLLNFQERAMEIWGPTDGDILAQSNTVHPADSGIRPSVPPRDGWGLSRLHETCVDVSAEDEPAGTAWICTSACRELKSTESAA